MDQDVKRERPRQDSPEAQKREAERVPERAPGNGAYDEEIEESFPASDPPSSTQP